MFLIDQGKTGARSARDAPGRGVPLGGNQNVKRFETEMTPAFQSVDASKTAPLPRLLPLRFFSEIRKALSPRSTGLRSGHPLPRRGKTAERHPAARAVRGLERFHLKVGRNPACASKGWSFQRSVFRRLEKIWLVCPDVGKKRHPRSKGWKKIGTRVQTLGEFFPRAWLENIAAISYQR